MIRLSYFRLLFFGVCVTLLYSCTSQPANSSKQELVGSTDSLSGKTTTALSDTPAAPIVSTLSTAISCTREMLPDDSMNYMAGGAGAYRPTQPNPIPAVLPAAAGMVYIPGGEFSMGIPDPTRVKGGGKEAMPDARPIHRVKLKAFLMDEHEVTNAEFAAFVKATGYVTLAEKKPTREEF
ncbi:MAG: formylglycine-generating enzyme family protein, partial [Bacteroidetes bacterium]|nr:formylglycine-generating enzyme family protein [Bacteroidota bacterium]